MPSSSDQELFELYLELADLQTESGRAKEAADAYALGFYYARRLGARDRMQRCRQRVKECNPAHVASKDDYAPLFYAQLLMKYPPDEAKATLKAMRRSSAAAVTALAEKTVIRAGQFEAKSDTRPETKYESRPESTPAATASKPQPKRDFTKAAVETKSTPTPKPTSKADAAAKPNVAPAAQVADEIEPAPAPKPAKRPVQEQTYYSLGNDVWMTGDPSTISKFFGEATGESEESEDDTSSPVTPVGPMAPPTSSERVSSLPKLPPLPDRRSKFAKPTAAEDTTPPASPKPQPASRKPQKLTFREPIFKDGLSAKSNPPTANTMAGAREPQQELPPPAPQAAPVAPPSQPVAQQIPPQVAPATPAPSVLDNAMPWTPMLPPQMQAAPHWQMGTPMPSYAIPAMPMNPPMQAPMQGYTTQPMPSYPTNAAAPGWGVHPGMPGGAPSEMPRAPWPNETPATMQHHHPMPFDSAQPKGAAGAIEEEPVLSTKTAKDSEAKSRPELSPLDHVVNFSAGLAVCVGTLAAVFFGAQLYPKMVELAQTPPPSKIEIHDDEPTQTTVAKPHPDSYRSGSGLIIPPVDVEIERDPAPAPIVPATVTPTATGSRTQHFAVPSSSQSQVHSAATSTAIPPQPAASAQAAANHGQEKDEFASFSTLFPEAEKLAPPPAPVPAAPAPAVPQDDWKPRSSVRR